MLIRVNLKNILSLAPVFCIFLSGASFATDTTITTASSTQVALESGDTLTITMADTDDKLNVAGKPAIILKGDSQVTINAGDVVRSGIQGPVITAVASDGANNSVVTINSGGSVTAASGYRAFDTSAASNTRLYLTVKSGGTVTGEILTATGLSDLVTLEGGTIVGQVNLFQPGSAPLTIQRSETGTVSGGTITGVLNATDGKETRLVIQNTISGGTTTFSSGGNILNYDIRVGGGQSGNGNFTLNHEANTANAQNATVDSGSTFTVGTGGSINFSGKTLTNGGTFGTTGDGTIADIGTLTNSGTFTLNSTGTVGDITTITNTGTLNVTNVGTTGTITTFNNEGGGTVNFDSALSGAVSNFNNNHIVNLNVNSAIPAATTIITNQNATLNVNGVTLANPISLVATDGLPTLNINSSSSGTASGGTISNTISASKTQDSAIPKMNIRNTSTGTTTFTLENNMSNVEVEVGETGNAQLTLAANVDIGVAGAQDFTINSGSTLFLNANCEVFGKNLVNNGTVDAIAGFTGFSVSTDGGTLVNNGIVKGSGGTAELRFDDRSVGKATQTITNSSGATLTGKIARNSGGGAITDMTAINNGTITGDINLHDVGNDADTAIITNTGTITGNILASRRTATININGGSVSGNITGNQGTTGNTTINLNGGSVVGNITGSTNGNTLINLDGGTLTGTIDGVATGANVLDVKSSFTTDGTITNMPTVQVTGSGAIFTVQNNITNVDTDLNISSNSTLTTNGGTITGTGSSGSTNNGTFNINDAVTLTGSNFTNSSTGSLNLSANFDVGSNSLINNSGGTVTVSGTRTLTGSYTNSGNHALSVTDDTTFDKLTIVGAGRSANLDNATVKVNRIGDTFISNDTSWTIVEGTDTNASITGATIEKVYNSALDTYTLSTSNEDIILTFTRDYNESSNSILTTSVGGAINSISNTSGTDLATVESALSGLSTTRELDSAARQLAVDVSGGLQTGSFTAATQSIGAIESRINLTRLEGFYADEENGYSSGENYGEASDWIKFFGNFVRQTEKASSPGFNSRTYGLALGGDLRVNENFILGTALSFARTNVQTKTFPANLMDINSYQGTLYGSWNEENYFIDGFLGFAYNGIDNERNVLLTGINRTLKSDFHSLQPTAKVRYGYSFKYDSLKITPIASLQYTSLHYSTYSEEGNSAVALVDVSTESTKEIKGGVGFMVSYNGSNRNWLQFNPEAHLTYLYDFQGDHQVSTSTFSGGGASFVSEGQKVSQSTISFGVGVTLLTKNNFELLGSFDGEVRDRFLSQSWVLTLKYTPDFV